MKYEIESRMVVLNEENMEEKLFELLEDLDQDLVGENGEEYVINKEYGSDLEYFIAITDDKLNLEDRVRSILYKVERYWGNYYDMTDIGTMEYKGELIVSVAVASF